MKEFVSINGNIYKPEEAHISVFDRGFLFGDAVYEVTRGYGPILFKLEEHNARLRRSAQRIDMDLGIDDDDLIKEMYNVFKASETEDMYLRVQISRGSSRPNIDPRLSQTTTRVIYVLDMARKPESLYETGIKVVTSDVVRNTKRALDPNIKSGNYLNNILALQEGIAKGADECIFRNSEGKLTEGTTSNIFAVKNGIVFTPPNDFDILHGITRKILFEKCNELNIPLKEDGFDREFLENSDEAFITSSTREVMPVKQVNDKTINATPGEISKKLLNAYREEIKIYSEWAKSNHPWK